MCRDLLREDLHGGLKLLGAPLQVLVPPIGLRPKLHQHVFYGLRCGAFRNTRPQEIHARPHAEGVRASSPNQEQRAWRHVRARAPANPPAEPGSRAPTKSRTGRLKGGGRGQTSPPADGPATRGTLIRVRPGGLIKMAASRTRRTGCGLRCRRVKL